MDSVFIGIQFPPWLQTQRNINTINLANASISGSLPRWGENIFTNPEFLYLSNNFLTGSIPEELCNFRSLVVLSLANNQLTGKIPLCLGNLSLILLDLSNNSLSGQIPHTLGNIGALRLLYLNGNKLFGELPSSLRNLRFLDYLDLGNNQFRDLIPDWIGKQFTSLLCLRLQSNYFYGNVSVNLCQVPYLQVLNLSENNLVGSIPPCLGNLSMMRSDAHIDRIFNSRDGIFYSWGSFWIIMKGLELKYSSNLEYVKSISLSGNNLHGEIPDELMDMDGLQSLNLSNNNLSGRIPVRIDNLKHLESLDLSVNQLSGTIPRSLATIDTLSNLNLSFNNLVGQVPSGIHFDTLNDPSIYEGNQGLCGKPVAKSCPDDSPPVASSHGDDNTYDKFEFSWFYSGIGPGFAVGLLGFFFVLYLKKSWRHALFRFLESICDRAIIAFAVKISNFKRRVN